MSDTPDWSTLASFTSDRLFPVRVSDGPMLNADQQFSVAVDQYSSLVISATAGVSLVLRVDHYQSADDSLVGINASFTEYLTSVDTARTSQWVIPIQGSRVVVTNQSTQAVACVIYGSNRTVPRPQMVGDQNMPRSFGFTGNVVISTAVVLAPKDAGKASTVFNDKILCRFTTPAGTGAYFGYRFIDQAGTRREIYVNQLAANGQFWGEIAQPVCPVLWVAYPYVTASAQSFALDLTQI